MPSWTASLKQWLNGLSSPSNGVPSSPGTPQLAAVGQAVAALEWAMCSALCDGHRGPWLREDAETDPTASNAFAADVSFERLLDGPAAVSRAVGLALSGQRVAAFADGNALPAVADRVAMAVGRRVPLVVHAHLRAASRQASTYGSGHHGYHALTDAGAFLAMATHPQQAVDLAVAARRIAELSLTPGIVTMDGLHTALGMASLRMPEAALLRDFVGAPDDVVDTPTPGQAMLFGSQRRRMPAWMDPDRPVGLGLPQGGADHAAAASAQRAFFGDGLAPLLRDVLSQLSHRTGRALPMVQTFKTADARWVLVAQGAMVELAEKVAQHLRDKAGMKVGVVGLVFIRPFPSREFTEALSHAEVITVLEPSEGPLGVTPPLMREVRAEISSAKVRWVSALAGRGGQAVNAAEMAAVFENMKAGAQARLVLELGAGGWTTAFPKRQTALQAVQREFPALGTHAVLADAPLELRQPGLQIVDVLAVDPQPLDNTLPALAAAMGSTVRGRWQQLQPGAWQARLWAALDEPGPVDEAAEPDVVVALSPRALAAQRIKPKGLMVVQSEDAPDAQAVWERLPLAWRRFLADRKARLLVVPDVASLNAAAWKAMLGAGDSAPETHACEALPSAHLEPQPPVPAWARRVASSDGTYDSLSRFHGEVLQPRAAGESAATAEPFVAMAAAPSGSALFSNAGAARRHLPLVDAAACTGCGDCWSACPDSAMGVAALRTEAWLNGAWDLVPASRRQGADRLKRSHKQLAARVDGLLAERGAAVADAGIFREAMGWLVEKMALEAPEADAFRQTLDAQLAAGAAAPLLVNAPFFRHAHKAAKGTGDLLTLVINPQACQGCGICAVQCQPGAIQMVPDTPQQVSALEAGWRVFEQLPDTSGQTIARVGQEPDVGPLAALLTSRHCLAAVSGADRAHPGSGERLALRLAAAVVESHIQAGMAQRAAKVMGLVDDVKKKLHATLSSGLPDVKVDEIADALSQAGPKRAALGDILSHVERTPTTATVDAAAARRLADLAIRLQAMHDRWVKGSGGLGRSRFCLVADDAIGQWLAGFPYNPVFAPLLVDGGTAAPELVAGLAQGMLNRALDEFRLVRHAELALEAPSDLPFKEEALARLTVKDLPPDVLAAHPPVLYVARWEDVSAHGAAGLMALLTSGLPVRVLLLDGLQPRATGVDPALVAMAQRSVYVANCSLAHPAHMYQAWAQALAYPAAALVRVHAPSPQRDGFSTDATVARAAAAVAHRAHLLFRFHPQTGGVFGSHLNLDGNAAPREVFGATEDGTLLTPAQFALGETRYARHFVPCPAKGPPPEWLDLQKWLALDPAARVAKVPTVKQADGTVVALGEALIGFVLARQELWQTLQELAGVVTPFTAQVAADADTAVAARHASELKALNEAHAAQLAQLAANHQAAVAEQLKSRLMQLAGLKPPTASAQG